MRRLLLSMTVVFVVQLFVGVGVIPGRLLDIVVDGWIVGIAVFMFVILGVVVSMVF